MGRLIVTRMKKRSSARRHRFSVPLSNLQPAVLTTVAFAVVAAIVVASFLHQARSSQEDDWTQSIPWDPSWPGLPAASMASTREIDEVRALYAFAGTNPGVLKYIPCYCGCQSQGHRSNHDCYVAQRAVDGRVIEWNTHGMTCSIGHDISGDVMLWRENRRPTSATRNDIDLEYASRGPGTPTPRPPDADATSR